MNNSIFGMMAHKTHKFKDSNTSWAVKNGYQRTWRGYKRKWAKAKTEYGEGWNGKECSRGGSTCRANWHRNRRQRGTHLRKHSLAIGNPRS